MTKYDPEYRRARYLKDRERILAKILLVKILLIIARVLIKKTEEK